MTHLNSKRKNINRLQLKKDLCQTFSEARLILGKEFVVITNPEVGDSIVITKKTFLEICKAFYEGY